MRRIVIWAAFIATMSALFASSSAQLTIPRIAPNGNDSAMANAAESLYLDFRSGASAYLGTVTESHPTTEDTPSLDTPPLHIGQATFDVSEVLHGPATRVVQLRYIFPETPLTVGTNLFLAWPDLRTLAPNTQLVVLAMPLVRRPPGSKQTSSTPDARGVARIFVVTGPDDPIVGAFRRMDALFAMKGDALRDGLAKAAADTQPVLNDYAVDQAMTVLKGSDAISVLTPAMAHYADPNYPTRYMGQAMRGIGGLASDAKATMEDKKAAVRAFVAAIERGSTSGSSMAYKQLAELIQHPGFETPLPFLSADEITRADAALAALTNRDHVVDKTTMKADRDWLAKGGATTAPATLL